MSSPGESISPLEHNVMGIGSRKFASGSLEVIESGVAPISTP